MTIVEQMEKHFRDVVKAFPTLKPSSDHFLKEAHRIAALLPKPIDPLLPKAREIAADTLVASECYFTKTTDEIRSGMRDDSMWVRCALAGLRAGRGA